MHETVEEIKKFNIRRRLKSVILSAVSSFKWQKPIIPVESEEDFPEDSEMLEEQRRAAVFAEDQASSLGKCHVWAAYLIEFLHA